MYAAVVRSFDQPPQFEEVPTPRPHAASEVLVDVIASGLHPRVRSQANGSHYTSNDELPLVPGIDGVGRAPDGTLRYFILPDTSMGAMAEQTVVDLRRSFVLPETSDPILIAAAINPAMSSWVALRQRMHFQPSQRVLVLGATGNAGQLAIQVAKHLGAGHVIGAGRDRRSLDALPDLGADETVALDNADAVEQLGRAAREVDVVLDYLWGQRTADAITALATNRAEATQPLTWVEIGSVSGPSAAIPSAALRAMRLQIVGSGQGSVPTSDILAELGELARQVNAGTFQIAARPVPLRDVAKAWTESAGSRHRLVLTP